MDFGDIYKKSKSYFYTPCGWDQQKLIENCEKYDCLKSSNFNSINN